MHEFVRVYRPYVRAAGWLVLVILAWYVFSQTSAALKAPMPEVKETKPPVSITSTPKPDKAKTASAKPKVNAIGQIRVTIAGSLNIRASADRGSAVVGSAPKGTKLAVLSKEDGWYKISAPSGVKGYVTASSRFVETVWMR